MSYDSDTARTYVENGGGYCPECDHDEPRSSRPRNEGEGMVCLDYECPACRAQWQDVYLLGDVEQLRPGIHADQQQLFTVHPHNERNTDVAMTNTES